MRVLDRYLLTFLGIVVLTGIVVVSPRRPDEAPLPPMGAPPLELHDWVGADGAPDDVLPIDERAVDGFRRTYRKQGATVWLAVSRYRATGPLVRPAIKQIAALRGASAVTRSMLTIHPNGVPGASRSVGVISLTRGGRGYRIVYWYLLDGDLVIDDYALRLRLLLDGLRMRPRNLVLVRVATGNDAPAEALLRALLRHLVPA